MGLVWKEQTDHFRCTATQLVEELSRHCRKLPGGRQPVLKFVLALLTLIYPLLVYFGLAHFRPGTLGLLLGLIALLRMGVVGRGERAWVLVPLGLMIGYSCLIAWQDSEQLLRFYPVLVSGIFLFVFAWTLFHPPPLIERLARARGMAISEDGVGYIRVVTWIWCGFFVMNAGVAAWTAWYAPLSWWALYNGLLSYLIMGTLFGGEMLFRVHYKRRAARRRAAAGRDEAGP